MLISPPAHSVSVGYPFDVPGTQYCTTNTYSISISLVSLLNLHLRLNATDRNPSQLVVGQASISLWNLRLTEGGCVPSDTADNDHPLRAKGQPGGDGRWAAGSSESSSCSVVISGYQ